MKTFLIKTAQLKNETKQNKAKGWDYGKGAFRVCGRNEKGIREVKGLELPKCIN